MVYDGYMKKYEYEDKNNDNNNDEKDDDSIQYMIWYNMIHIWCWQERVRG